MFKLFLTFIFWLSFLAGCKENTTGPLNSSQVRLAMKYSTVQATVVPASSRLVIAGINSADSIIVVRARLVLEHIELKNESDSQHIHTQPFVVDLDLTGGLHDFTLSTIPFGTYSKIEFRVHRVDSSDLSHIPANEHALFSDFLQGERSSVIIEGTVFMNGAGQPFVFKSRINAEQELEFHPAIVASESHGLVNVTMVIHSEGWFRNLDGTLMDPREGTNGNQIDNNIKASIRVFEDADHDGNDD